uniref:Uncharacterized protein n=1 Tax=Megaselia scalaris TaxID=36166 RepID=T1H0Y4_MEGSC
MKGELIIWTTVIWTQSYRQRSFGQRHLTFGHLDAKCQLSNRYSFGQPIFGQRSDGQEKGRLRTEPDINAMPAATLRTKSLE